MNAHSKVPPAFLPLFAAYPVLFIAGANPGQAQFTTVLAVVLAAVAAAVLAWLALRPVAASAQSAAVAGRRAGRDVLRLWLFRQLAGCVRRFAAAWRFRDPQPAGPRAAVPVLCRDRLGRRGVDTDRAGCAVQVDAEARASRRRSASRRPFSSQITVFQIGSAQLRSAGAHPIQADREGTASDVERAVERARHLFHRARRLCAAGRTRPSTTVSTTVHFLGNCRRGACRYRRRARPTMHWTFLSLVSTLNMRYVADLFQGRLGPESLDRSIVYEAIRDNDVARISAEKRLRNRAPAFDLGCDVRKSVCRP